MYNFHFLLVRFAALRHYDVITGICRRFLNSAQYAGKEVVYQLGNNDADGIAAACAEVYSQYIGLVVMFARIALDTVEGETFSARAISLMVICGLFMV